MACMVEKPIADVNVFTIRPDQEGVWTVTQGIVVDHKGLLITTPNGPKVNIPITRDACVTHANGHMLLYRCSLVALTIGGRPAFRIGAHGTSSAGTLFLVYTEPDVVWARDWQSQFGNTDIWPGVEPSPHLKVSVGRRIDRTKRHLVWVRPGEGVLCADSNRVVAEIVGACGFVPPIIRRASKQIIHSHMQRYRGGLKPEDFRGRRWVEAAISDLTRNDSN